MSIRKRWLSVFGEANNKRHQEPICVAFVQPIKATTDLLSRFLSDCRWPICCDCSKIAMSDVVPIGNQCHHGPINIGSASPGEARVAVRLLLDNSICDGRCIRCSERTADAYWRLVSSIAAMKQTTADGLQ